jgi:hypothetical protein
VIPPEVASAPELEPDAWVVALLEPLLPAEVDPELDPPPVVPLEPPPPDPDPEDDEPVPARQIEDALQGGVQEFVAVSQVWPW